MTDHNSETSVRNWNTRITKYFIENHRLTILLLVFIIALGTASTLLMRTTGFPNPDINIIVVQTAYLGASAETVEKTISTPIEGVIKNISGVDTVTSRSNSSFSVQVVDIADSADPNEVRTKIDAGIRSLQLPDGAKDPEVSIPTVAGPDIVYTISNTNLDTLYADVQSISSEIEGIKATSTVTPLYALEKVVSVSVNEDELKDKGLTLSQVQGALTSLNESIPAASNVTVNDENQNIFTIASESIASDQPIAVIEDLLIRAEGTTTVQTARGPQSIAVSEVRLKDVATVGTTVRFVDDAASIASYSEVNSDENSTGYAVVLNVDAVDGTQISDYTADINSAIAGLSNVSRVSIGEAVPNDLAEGQSVMLEQYSAAEFNDRQVSEVVSGLIGGPLHIDSPFKHIGWALGGIQLVFLVMLAFVSWRAAIIAAISIPLSLVFSNIYLYLIGEDLNTLVLFSLVLVIGLVVDPALVILESIQRKVDIGLTKKDAAIAAVNDVGRGLFIATLTNIVVFAPFALISGLLGQIFAYIPLTVVPAIIGSYVVPLVFLAWFGSRFLKKGKQTGESEEENLFFASQWLIRFNTRLLSGSVFIRAGIVILALSIAMGVSGYFFSSGKISVVQFSSSSDSDYATVLITPYPTTPADMEAKYLADVFNTIQTNPDVLHVFPLDDAGTFYVRLTPTDKRVDGQIAKDIVQELRDATAEQSKNFYDYQVRVDSVGGPVANYDIALSVAGNNTEDRKAAVIAIGKTMEKLCVVDNTFSIAEECAGERVIDKVDDSYTNKEQTNLEVRLKRDALAEKQLIVANAPLGLLVNQAIQQAYEPNAGQAVTTTTINDEQIDVVLKSQSDSPKTLDEIRDIVVLETPLETIRLRDVADVEEVVGSSQILHVNGEPLTIVQARAKDGYKDQTKVGVITQTLVDYYQANDGERMKEFNLTADDISSYSEGSSASALRSFSDLLRALVLAIVISYILLAVFFNSFTQPLVILYTIPLTFIGIFPGLAWFSNGEFGFLEIIGLIILVGLVENVAIFLIDAARYKIEHDGWDPKRAIAYASGVRLRPVLMTKFTAIASLLPLAILSETYRPISIVIMAGLLTSGFTSLVTTPILYIYFQSISKHFWAAGFGGKVLWFLFWPIMSCIYAVKERKAKA